MRTGYKRRQRMVKWLLSAGVAAFIFVDLIPIFFTVITSFKSRDEYVYNVFSIPERWSLENYANLFEAYDVPQMFLSSLTVTIIPIFFIVYFGAMAAFAIGKFEFKGRRIFANMIFPLMSIPSVVMLFPLFRLFSKLNMTNKFGSVIVIYIGLILPFILNMLTSFMSSISSSYLEAAMIDGCGFWQMFHRIILPLLAPALSATTIVGAMWLWNEMLIAFIFLQDEAKRTLVVGLTSMQGLFQLDVPLLMAGATITTVPVILIFVFGQKWFIRGLTAGGVK